MAYRKSKWVEQQLADRREAILQAAREQAAEVGFGAAQVSAIAARAGVAAGTIYRHFPSKADLFAEVLATTSRREVAICAEIAAAGDTTAASLYESVRGFALRAVRGRRLAYTLIGEPGDLAIEEARLAYRQALGDVFEDLIRRGVAAGDFPAQDAHTSAACVVGALLEAMVGPLAPEATIINDSGEQLAAEVARFCLRAVSGNGDYE